MFHMNFMQLLYMGKDLLIMYNLIFYSKATSLWTAVNLSRAVLADLLKSVQRGC